MPGCHAPQHCLEGKDVGTIPEGKGLHVQHREILSEGSVITTVEL